MTFLQPLYLFGMVFVSIPIIIHLWFQRKLKKIPFSTLKFLQTAEAKRLGLLRLREIIILILRCLFIMFCVLSLAKPYVKSGFFSAGRLKSVVVILDNSYSMRYRNNFTEAQAKARDLLSRYAPKAEFAILPLCSSNDKDDTNNIFWVSKASALSLIDRINPSFEAGNLHDLLINKTISNAQYDIEYLYIGDGQENIFRNYHPDIINGKQLHWVELTAGNNLTVTQVTRKDPIAIPADNYTLVATIENFSANTWQGTITLRAGDYQLENELEIKPHGKALVDFELPISLTYGTITAYDDSLHLDNIYYFSKSLRSILNVLIVDKNTYLQTALSAPGAIQSPFQSRLVNSISHVDLRKYDVIILNGVTKIADQDRIKLQNFISTPNKGILFLLGPEVGPNIRTVLGEQYNIETKISPKGYITLDWIDYTHPVLKIFQGKTTLKNIKIFELQKINAGQGIVAKTTGNYPFIILKNNIGIVATQFTPRTTDIIYKTAFVPLVYRLVAHVAQQTEQREHFVGEKIALYEWVKASTGEYLRKENKFIKPGFYSDHKQNTIAVNIIPDEGNLKPLTGQAIKILGIKILQPDIDLAGGNLATTFLLLALAALMLELLMLLIR